MVLWYDTWDRENGGIIMRRDRVLSGGVYALKAVWDDLYALNPPAVFLLLGSLCTVFLYAWGSSKIALVMLSCTAFSYLVGRCVRGWGRVLLGSVFLLFMVVITLASILIGFLLCFDFSPNGRENYAQIRRDFFPKEIPATAYDIQVWSRMGTGYRRDESYLSYRDTKENIRSYAMIGRARSEMRSRYPHINEVIRVPRITVDETAVEPRFAMRPLWQRIFIDYVPHPAEIGVLKEKFVFYVWDINSDPNYPQAKIIGISENGTHVIFYAVGE